MCGICGIVDFGAGRDLGDSLRAMTEILAHRGPDGHDVWIDSAAGVGLGQRRLAIIDLSAAGHQPFHSADGRWVVTYNGEIYNAGDLRPELEAKGVCFRGHSDTEVLVEAIAVWGLRETVARINGMFAFAAWDRQRREVTLVRDRLGIKPLYWGFEGKRLLFGSELKAFSAAPGWDRTLDRPALAAYFRFSYVPAPHSIYQGIKKLEPGCLLTLSEGGDPRIERYWDLRQVAREGLARRHPLADDEAEAQATTLLKDAVRRQMVSDVPLGAFLSGGVDSSLVTALMQSQSSQPVRSFTIGFNEAGYDEAVYAKAVSRHLGTDHTELYVEPSHALDVLPRLQDMYDEPFSDSSQIPTFLVSEMTRNHVTVALSGDGGDELFGGYNRYLWCQTLSRRLGFLPAGLRRAAAGLITRASPAAWDSLAAVTPVARRQERFGEKLHKLAGILDLDGDALYRSLLTQWEGLVLGAEESKGIAWDKTVADDLPDLMDRMQFVDSATYLPDDILTKVDRASMAVSLEVRVPLLDHRVVESVWALPPQFKLRGGKGKWLLRRILSRYVPDRLIDRPKMGFGVPIDSWLRGPLRAWATDLLSADRLKAQGILDPAPITQKLQEHLDGRRNWQHHLWTVLMFQAWLEKEKQ